MVAAKRTVCASTIKRRVDVKVSESLLFLHAVSGCDTTSRPHGIGKVGVLKKYAALAESAATFMASESSKVALETAGERALLIMYGIQVDDLKTARLQRFQTKVATAARYVPPEKLPPTSDAAQFHSHCVFSRYKHGKGTIFFLRSGDGTFNLKFQLWIRKTDEIEQNSTNPFPSEISKHITKLFYQIGQRPSVFAFVSHSSDEIEFVRQEVAFSANKSVWEVDLALETLELLKIKVDESTVGFLDCFIKATVFEIQDRKSSIAESLNVTENDCTPNVFIVVRKDHLLLTKDYFDTVLALTVPGHLITINPTGYKAVFTRQGNLVIHTGRETFIVDNNSSQIASAKGLPMNELEFSSYPWCHQDNLPHETIADTVLAWANQSFVYLSLNSTIGFLSVNVPSYFQDEGFRLLDVKINGICHCIFYLIESSTCPECNGSKVIGYTTQDYETNAWRNVTLLLEEQRFDNGLNWSFQFLPPNSLSMLLWNSRDVFYKSGKDETTIIITKKGSISSSGDESIVQVVTSNNGEYLVLYEDYSLFYGRIGVVYMIQ
ncbi:Hypothetical predicted protein, partial [Paramuricea clavata]